MKSKGNSKIIGAAIAPTTALPSLVWNRHPVRVMMMPKMAAAASNVTGAMGSETPDVMWG